MSNVYWVISQLDEEIRAKFRLQEFVCKPGEPVRLDSDKDPDDPGFIFYGENQADGKPMAQLFIDCLPMKYQHSFNISKKPDKIKVEELHKTPKATDAEKPNAPGMEYPEGLPEIDWTLSQMMKYIKEYDEDLSKLLIKRRRLNKETALLAFYEKHDPAEYGKLKHMIEHAVG